MLLFRVKFRNPDVSGNVNNLRQPVIFQPALAKPETPTLKQI